MPGEGGGAVTLPMGISVRLLAGFDDPALADDAWHGLLPQGPTDTLFLTPCWQRTWWQVFGRGQLLLVGIFQGDALVGLAPLFADGDMVFFVGSGGSDYLDFVGQIDGADVLAEVLAVARDAVPSCLGFRFYHVPDTSPTGQKLGDAARLLGCACHDEGELPAPSARLAEAGQALTRKQSLLRHQRFFEREGELGVRQLRTAAEILPRLDAFFAQHIARWADTPHPSLFLDLAQQTFYRRLAEQAPPWLRFTEIAWNGRPIAFHFGFSYRGSYLWYKPSFAIDLARHSPGEVLIRQLLLAALEEGAEEFDLGLGDEPFKRRFANQVRLVRTWGIYPQG